jgi:hypothetical protein
MTAEEIYLLVVAGLTWYCTGASWMLQFVCYPTYALVGEKEFVPFHVDFGKRLLPTAVIPMSLTNLLLIATLLFRPDTVPLWIAIGLAVCAGVVMGTTIVLEVPKHQKLDKDGKDDSLIAALVRDNLPRVACWTLASLLCVYALVLVFG